MTLKLRTALCGRCARPWYVNGLDVLDDGVCPYCGHEQLQPKARSSSLAVGPFIEWLRECLRQRGGCVSTLSSDLGVDEAWVRRILDRRYPGVKLQTVDEWTVRLGDPGALYLMYPLGEDGV